MLRTVFCGWPMRVSGMPPTASLCAKGQYTIPDHTGESQAVGSDYFSEQQRSVCHAHHWFREEDRFTILAAWVVNLLNPVLRVGR